ALARRGAEFVESEPHPGAVGLVSFIQPASACGVLVEINQPIAPISPALHDPAGQAPGTTPRAPRRRKPPAPPSEDEPLATAPGVDAGQVEGPPDAGPPPESSPDAESVEASP